MGLYYLPRCKLGGIHAIALSHPHYYPAQVEWAETFNVPIYIHEDDKEWVMWPSDHIIFWSGDTFEVADGLILYRLGGHFRGGAVLHWEDGHDGKGALLTGDIIQVVADRNWVSFMYSYPNLIPRLYNAFHRMVKDGANQAVQKSARRYIDALQGKLFTT
jgi:hypothetical protein